jgi:flavin-dependent dehydrogenase
MSKKYDAVIVGARCAGAATAMLLARAGARVLLVDRGAYGTDTLSTHALMRGAVLQLARWGVLPSIVSRGTPAVRSTTFSYTHEDISVEIEPRFGVDALYAPRRTVLDRILVDAAVESGAEAVFGTYVDDVITGAGGRVHGISAVTRGVRQHIHADRTIGADGVHSTVAHRVRADALVEGRYATAVLYSYWRGLRVDGFYWRFHQKASVGVIPTNHAAACVFVAVPSNRLREELRGSAASAYRPMIWHAAPSVAAQLADATMTEPIRGFGGRVGFIKRAAGPGWALVGDAGYFKDPLTAHGITDALRDAELLARAIVKGTETALTDYDDARVDLSLRQFDLADEIASFSWTDERLQELHRAFSREMSREVRTLAALGPASFTMTRGVCAS